LPENLINKHWMMVLGCTLLATSTSAQTNTPVGPRKITVYLAADGTQLPSAEGADHQVEISLRDSVSGMMREYHPSGKLWRIVPYVHVGRGVRHGVELTYDENGQLRRRQEFAAGRQQGELQLFDTEGKLTRKVVFDNDQRVSQQCFTSAGDPKTCATEKVLPSFPGGTNGLVRAIEQAVAVPHEDLAKHRFGTVWLKFVVDKNGRIIGANADPKNQEGSKVILPPSPAMCQAAVAALGSIKFGSGGEQDGEPAAVMYALPIKVGQPASGYAIVHSTDVWEHQPKVTFLED
jgi:hypothetical protein